MVACIVAVGSELLTPLRVDTNSLAITERLNAVGYDVRLKAVVGDHVEELTRVLESALGWANVIIITGGLGPTEDDLTRDALALVLNAPLSVDEQIADQIRDRFARRGLAMPAINRRQAMVPLGATVLENPNGSAPGLLMKRGDGFIIALPGPPREMIPMLEALIRDRLAAGSGGAGLFRRIVRITGRTESDVDACAQPVYGQWLAQPIPITTTILAALGQVELHLTACAGQRALADAALDSAVEQLRTVLGPAIYSLDGRPLEAVIGEMLRARKLTVAVAESCTGGLLASRLTDVPGSSDYVEEGVVCYSNRAKTDLAGVDPALIAEHGAVSEPVALALASGIKSRAGTSVGIGITGIAGPGGGSPQKPVGTVSLAVVSGGRNRVRTIQFFGGREMVKFQATQAAMNMLRLMLLEDPDASLRCH